jgi:hypothetical protein
MRVHGKSTIYFSDMMRFSKKNFDAQGVRSFEHIRPHTFSPFITYVEEKSTDQKIFSIDQKIFFIDEKINSTDEEINLIDQKLYLIDEKYFLIDEKLFLIDQKSFFIGARGHAFTAEWEKKNITYSLQGAEAQTFNINL